MPIPYKAMQRKNPQEPTAPAKFYAYDVTRSRLSEDEAAELIAEQMGTSIAAARGFMEAQGIVYTRALCHGDVVPLAGLGSLSAGVTSDGVATPEELARVKKEKTANFRTAPELKNALERAGDLYTGDVTLLPPPTP